MSLISLVFPQLAWAELSHILSFLTIKEIYLLGGTKRTAFVTFLREKSLRQYSGYRVSPIRFLWRGSDHDKIALVSYPRSGNSFLRKLIEIETGIATGSDSRPNRTLASSLLRYGYKGEGITDESVWVVKSHYPERLGYIRFPASRVILLVRNPFDAIESYFHMGMTNTHDKMLSKEAFQSLTTIWEDFVKNEAQVWAEFHRFWIRKHFDIPILLVRYEDLLANKEETIDKVSLFINSNNPPKGLSRYWMKSFDHLGKRKLPISTLSSHDEISNNSNELSNDSTTRIDVRAEPLPAPSGAAPVEANTLGYKPKKKIIGKGLHAMSADGISAIMEHCGPISDALGYQVMDSERPEPSVKAAHVDIAKLINCSFAIGPEPPLIPPPPPLLPHSTVQENLTSFPNTLLQSATNYTVKNTASRKEVLLNDYYTMRKQDDQFGRKITELRRSMTELDKKPFPTA